MTIVQIIISLDVSSHKVLSLNKAINIFIVLLIALTFFSTGKGYYKCNSQKTIHLAECCAQKLSTCCPKTAKKKGVEYKKVCCVFEEFSDVDESLTTTKIEPKENRSDTTLFSAFLLKVNVLVSAIKRQYNFPPIIALWPITKKDLYKSLCLYLC